MSNQLIAYIEFLHPIRDDDKILISTAFERRSLTEGDYLFRPDHICKELFFVCSGILRIIVQTEKGIQLTHFFLKENQFCTILKSFNSQTIAAEGIQAACDVEVLAISKSRLLVLYESVPYLKTYHPAADNAAIQEGFLAACEEISGVKFPGANRIVHS